jgi:hypothetical protein
MVAGMKHLLAKKKNSASPAATKIVLSRQPRETVLDSFQTKTVELQTPLLFLTHENAGRVGVRNYLGRSRCKDEVPVGHPSALEGAWCIASCKDENLRPLTLRVVYQYNLRLAGSDLLKYFAKETGRSCSLHFSRQHQHAGPHLM